MKGKVTDEEREEHKSILLELCVAYGIEPFPEMFEGMDECILRHRPLLREARRFAKQISKAFRKKVDKELMGLINEVMV